MQGQYCSRCSGYYYTPLQEHAKFCPWEKGCPWCYEKYRSHQHTLDCPKKPPFQGSSPYPYGSAQCRYPASTATDWFWCKRCGINVMKDKLEEHLKTHPSQGLPDEKKEEIRVVDRRE